VIGVPLAGFGLANIDAGDRQRMTLRPTTTVLQDFAVEHGMDPTTASLGLGAAELMLDAMGGIALAGGFNAATPVYRSPYQVYLDPETGVGPMAIDTSTFTSGEATFGGGIRNPRQFWLEWSDRYGNTLSEQNQARIGMGRSPVVDDTWVQRFPETEPYLDETLVHHHLDYGPKAIPLPDPVHGLQPGWSIWHPPRFGGNPGVP